MRASGRVLVLGFLAAVCVPRAADADPILSTGAGSSCTGLVAATTVNCTLFDIDPLSSDIVSGDFLTNSDVALFQFTLTEEVQFSVSTSSYSTGSFDPSLGLFQSDGQIVTYSDPAGSGAMFAARGSDIDGANYDDQLALSLGPGIYRLALLMYPNDFSIDTQTGLDSLLAGFACDLVACASDLTNGSFAFSVTTTPTGVEPVPEPATLVLVGGGALTALVRRRRRVMNSLSVPRSR